MSSIMTHFPGTPRSIQTDTLTRLEEGWDQADVFVVGLPVSSGKSRIAITIARWLAKQKTKCNIITPTRILQEQYLQDFPRLHTIRNMDNVQCQLSEGQTQTFSCKEQRACSKEKRFCPGCPYMQSVRKAHAVPYGVYTNHGYMAHKLFANTLIADEAHQLIPMIQSLAGRTLWHHLYHFPSSVRTYGQLLRWVERHPKLKSDGKLEALHRELTSGKARYLVQRTSDLYHGREEECLKLLPIDIRDQPPILWPQGKVKKLVLLSATISRVDVEELGLDRRRVRFINAPSPIPAKQRPVLAHTRYGMSMREQEQNLPLLVADIRRILAENPEKGFIHAPYALAERLRAELGDHPRLMFHNRDNKQAQYQAFRASSPDEGRTLVASGLYEGVDLLEDMGRWQVIAKIPWPSLGEPAIAYRAEQDSEWYAWETAKVVLQAAGRICRSPTDFGKTIILDKSFKRLFEQYNEFFPNWWQESLTFCE